jgi:hypothetical protein
MGWHLPGFDDSEWNSTSSIAIDGPGVGFFRTELDLDVQDGELPFCQGPIGDSMLCDSQAYNPLDFRRSRYGRSLEVRLWLAGWGVPMPALRQRMAGVQLSLLEVSD